MLDKSDLATAELQFPAGRFPRELVLTPEGNALLATNFGSGTQQLVDLARLEARP